MRLRPATLGRLLLPLGLAWLAQVTFASPTANEFEPCHRSAAARLQRCLSEAGVGTGETCWAQVREFHAACRDTVVRAHQPTDAARLKALREAQRAAVNRPAGR